MTDSVLESFYCERAGTGRCHGDNTADWSGDVSFPSVVAPRLSTAHKPALPMKTRPEEQLINKMCSKDWNRQNKTHFIDQLTLRCNWLLIITSSYVFNFNPFVREENFGPNNRPSAILNLYNFINTRSLSTL